MAKKAGKKPAPKKAPKTMPISAAKIFAETSFATAQGMEREMAKDGRPYALTPEARDFWLNRHAKTIPRAHKNPKNKWNVDRPFVLPQAEQLGRVAAQNALADPANGGKPTIIVTKQHLKDASHTIARGPVCVAARAGRLGSGPYCPE